MKVKRAIIPAAGLGTRFLPATKALPKEMLPIVDKPAIQYIVEEAVQSGVENIIIVTGRHKRSIEDHFDKSLELEMALLEKEKNSLLEEINDISNLANIHFIRQKEPLGLGHAILCAEQFIGEEPFAVLLGDDVMVSEYPALKQLLDVYEQTNANIIGVQSVEPTEVSKYGIIDIESENKTLYSVHDLVEKPSIEEAPSNKAVMGRYILKPSIYKVLQNLEKGVGNEIQLTDALRKICKKEELYALEIKGQRYDIGDKLGYIKACIEIGLQREEVNIPLLNFLQRIVSSQRKRVYSD